MDQHRTADAPPFALQRRRLLQALPALAAGAPSLFAAAPEDHGIHPPPDAFVRTLPSLMEQAWVPGFAAAVVQRGRIVWQQSFGVAGLGTTQPINGQSLFPAASLGKPVFAQAVLQLAETGRLDLDRPLAALLAPSPAPLDAASPVTARHVLSHGTGFPNWRDNDADPLTSSFAPGSAFRYSGEGFYLLQRVMERITGQGFEPWMQHTVLAPLGMASSTYLWRDDAAARLVQCSQGRQPQPYPAFPAEVLEEEQKSPGTLWNHDTISGAMVARYKSPRPPAPHDMAPNAAWSLLTTVSDYARFLARVAAPQGTPLDLSVSLRRQRIRQATTINSALGWGLGWGVDAASGTLWQWGDNGGWKNFALLHPATQSGLVAFSNGSNGLHLADHLIRASTGREHAAFLWL